MIIESPARTSFGTDEYSFTQSTTVIATRKSRVTDSVKRACVENNVLTARNFVVEDVITNQCARERFGVGESIACPRIVHVCLL